MRVYGQNLSAQAVHHDTLGRLGADAGQSGQVRESVLIGHFGKKCERDRPEVPSQCLCDRDQAVCSLGHKACVCDKLGDDRERGLQEQLPVRQGSLQTFVYALVARPRRHLRQ